MWTAVRQLTGRQHQQPVVDGVTAESLNDHYAAISTDSTYSQPTRKQPSSSTELQYISEWCMFKLLDNLHHTATGLDGLPAWFIRLGAPVFYKPICQLFNQSRSTSTVPQQWKRACIRPTPKVSAPTRHADFRPISITPVLTRVMEKSVVRRFLYPAFLSPPQTLSFSNQFAFRPTVSPAAAVL